MPSAKEIKVFKLTLNVANAQIVHFLDVILAATRYA
jgi:hypothetical protein